MCYIKEHSFSLVGYVAKSSKIISHTFLYKWKVTVKMLAFNLFLTSRNQ